MSVPNQRDPDQIEITRSLLARVTQLEQTVTGRWGHGVEGKAANRPVAAAALAGVTYWATDTLTLSFCDGTGWIIMREPQQSYSTAWTLNGGAVGNGVFAGSYFRSGGFCDFYTRFTLGSTTSFAGLTSIIGITPTTIAATQPFWGPSVSLSSTGTQAYKGEVSAPGGAGFSVFALQASGANIVPSQLGAAIPFIWKATDIIEVTGRYQMGTPYL